MDDLPELFATNVLLTKKHRAKLKRQQLISQRSMSQIIRDLIDEKYPDPPPYQPKVSVNGIVLQYKDNSDTVEDKDFADLANGWSPELRAKFKIK